MYMEAREGVSVEELCKRHARRKEFVLSNKFCAKVFGMKQAQTLLPAPHCPHVLRRADTTHRWRLCRMRLGSPRCRGYGSFATMLGERSVWLTDDGKCRDEKTTAAGASPQRACIILVSDRPPAADCGGGASRSAAAAGPAATTPCVIFCWWLDAARRHIGNTA